MSSAAQQPLQDIIDAMPQAVLLINAERQVQLANPGAADLLGYTAQGLVGRAIEDLMPARYRNKRRLLRRAFANDRRLLRMGQVQSLLALRADGQEIPVEISLGQSFLTFGKPLQMAILTDRRAHQALLAAMHAREQASHRLSQAAHAANLAKSRFLATMSHEIRTPMNGILGMAQLLLLPDLQDAERRDYARTILSSGQTLLTLLNDILDLSKIEAGKFELHPTVFNPDSLLRETCNLFAGNAQAKNLQLDYQWHANGSQRYRADAHRVRQMLANLAGNALKFTQQGQIRIEGHEVLREHDSALLEFSVSDSGAGIAPDKLALLFTPFVQADSTIQHDFGGSGLGLSIVHNLALAMGGQVGVESQPGQGSRFWFQLRAQRVSAHDEARHAHRAEDIDPESAEVSPLAGARVLVVEDNLVNCMVIESMLARLDVQVSLVHDGQQAVDAITRSPQSPGYDLILMDLRLPLLDGYAATAQIRQWQADQQQPRLPIIALTADAFDEHRDQCLAAGMNDFLTKPIGLPALQAALGRWLPASIAERAAAASAGALAFQSTGPLLAQG